MNKSTIKTALLLAGLVASGHAAAGGGGTRALSSPTIMKTAMDMQANTLVITGRHFGAARPAVLLADQALEVQHFSEQKVVVGLPQGLAAASYGVTLTTGGPNRRSSNLFSTTILGTD